MEKVILKVNVVATASGCIFKNSNTGEVLGSVHASHDYKGRYFVKFCGELSRNGETYTDAVEYISDRIESVFALAGIDVEFVDTENEKKKVYVISEYRCTENGIYPRKIKVLSCKSTASNDLNRRLEHCVDCGYTIAEQGDNTYLFTKGNEKYIVSLFERKVDSYKEQEKDFGKLW